MTISVEVAHFAVDVGGRQPDRVCAPPACTGATAVTGPDRFPSSMLVPSPKSSVAERMLLVVGAARGGEHRDITTFKVEQLRTRGRRAGQRHRRPGLRGHLRRGRRRLAAGVALTRWCRRWSSAARALAVGIRHGGRAAQRAAIGGERHRHARHCASAGRRDRRDAPPPFRRLSRLSPDSCVP